MTEFFSGCLFLNVKVVPIVFPVWERTVIFWRKFVESCILWLRCLFSFDFDHKEFETKFHRFDQKVLFFASVFQTACLQSRNSVFRFCFRAFIWDPVAWWRYLVVTGSLSLRTWYGVSSWKQFDSRNFERNLLWSCKVSFVFIFLTFFMFSVGFPSFPSFW